MARPVKWLSLALNLLFLFIGYESLAQLVQLDSLVTNHDIVAYSADRTGNIYLGLAGGTIQKYGSELDSQATYNPRRVGDFKLVEAWHGFQVFAFNRKYQDFILLDRFLSRESRYDLGQTGLFFVDQASISADQNLWLFETNGMRLMKYNFRSGEVILDVVIDPWLNNNDHDFSFIREYQNLLFLIDRESGSYIFDNLGNFIKRLDTGTADYLSFHDEFVYYLNAGQLIQQGLYSEQNRVFQLPVQSYLGVLVFKDKAYLISKRKVDRFLIPKN